MTNMEGDKDFSTFSVPGAMSDMTLLSTPLPQAASTATKRRSIIGDEDLSSRDFNQTCGNGRETRYSTNNNNKSPLSQKKNQKEDKRLSLLEKSCKSMSDLQEEVVKVLEAQKRINLQKHENVDEYGHQKQIQMLINHQKLRSWASSADLNCNTESTKPYNKESHDFDFRVPKVPGASIAGKKFNREPQKGKSPRNLKPEPELNISSSSGVNYDLTSQLESINKLVQDTLGLDSASVCFSADGSKFGSARDSQMQLQNDRTSTASSVNSSLGVISSEVLEEVQRQPLVDVNQDLNYRLAQQLNIDTSLLRDGLDISSLAAERYKERVAAKCEENKENQRTSGRSSSDYWTLHGYSSDNSDSRNHTAKRLSLLSSGSGAEMESSNKAASFPRTSPRSLSEINFLSCSRKSPKSEKRSVSNPFAEYSNVSVSSADFEFEEDAMQRLDQDERQFSLASTRSLSGIYGDNNVSFSVNGEKLSMSSFLRSGSGPLGNLETGGSEAQRPQFGMPAHSPEKKSKPRAILPPPQDKSTFLVDEEPVRDTPWAPHSLLEQFSNIHTTEVTDSDSSVPSLSYISQMLEHIHEGANPREMLAQLMASKHESKKKPDISLRASRISSVVKGENSFCLGTDAECSLGASDRSKVLHPSFLYDSAVSSVCNVTDFEGDEEACVCVMTPQSMDFDVFNELSQPIEYSFSKACYVDGQRNDQAAYVNLPPKLVLNPGQRQTMTITIAAFNEGVVKIKIGVVRINPVTQARECSNVYGKVIAELPKVSLATHHGEMIPNPDCVFNGKYHHTIVMKNNGRSMVPLKLSLTQVTHPDGVRFHFGEREKKSVTVMIEPGQVMSQLVQCETPTVFSQLKSPETIIPVEARVDFFLATTDIYQLTPVNPVALVAPLKPYFYGAPSRLNVPSSLKLYNGSDHPVSFKTDIEHGYTVQPSTFTVLPLQTFLLSVGTAEMKNPLRCGILTLHSLNPRAMYTVKLREVRHSSVSSNSSLNTPQGSRATSPTTPSRNPVEDLKVACSHRQLVWGGCHLHQTVVKTFCIKNMGHQREKLRLTISGHTCFKIVSEKETLELELKLSLQPMENREIKVAVLATVIGPQWGHLTISRISSPADKNVLPLYAFGGRSNVNLTDGVFEVSQHMYLLLDEISLQGLFVLSNTGDDSAFFRITANTRASSGLLISPQEEVLAAGHTVAIHVGLSVTANRLEYLLRQTTQSVCVAHLTITYGNESTRQRLGRELRSLGQPLTDAVTVLSGIHAPPIANLDKLNASPNDAEELWREDIDEWAVQVFIKRSALEARRLDTSVNFVDLSKTLSKPH